MKAKITGLDSFQLIPENALERFIIESWQKREVSTCISVNDGVILLDFIIGKKGLSDEVLNMLGETLNQKVGIKINGDDIIFSTGKKIFMNLGIVGLSKLSNGVLRVSGGYDDVVPDNYFTKEEKVELADYMISLWQEWKKED